jgi:site-specific recombinase XerD
MTNLQPINQSANNLLKRVIWDSLSKESQIAYQTDYKLFFKYINKDPKDIGPQDIMSYIDYLKKEGYRANSINRKIAALSKMFNVFVIVKEMDNNPITLLKKIKKITMSVPKGNRSTLTIADIQAITGNTAQEKKIALIIRVLGSTGLRI